MSRNRKYGRGERTRPRPPEGESALRWMIDRGLTVLLWLLVLGAAAYGLKKLEPRALAVAANPAWELRWIDQPGADDEWLFARSEDEPNDKWVFSEIELERERYDLRRLLHLPLQSPALCPEVGSALSSSPWISHVRRIEKDPAGYLRIHAAFRRYCTFVVSGSIGYVVDDEGVRLPRQHASAVLPDFGMLLIEGARAPVPEVGECWAGQDIAAGLKLVHFLNERAPTALRYYFAAVDVSNFRDGQPGGWLRVRTIHPRTFLEWGLPPGSEYDIEARADRKLDKLWRIHEEHKGLPAGLCLDLRPVEEWFEVPCGG